MYSVITCEKLFSWNSSLLPTLSSLLPTSEIIAFYFFIITIILNYITLTCILLFQAPLLFPLIVLITLTYCSLVLALSYWNIVQLLKKIK